MPSAAAYVPVTRAQQDSSRQLSQSCTVRAFKVRLPAEVAPPKEELRARLAAKMEAMRQQRHAEERAARNAAAHEFHVRRASPTTSPCPQHTTKMSLSSKVADFLKTLLR